MTSVYLAGPITGINYQQATQWREWVTHMLSVYGIETLDPMAGKDDLQHETELKTSYASHSPETIFFEDIDALDEADMVLAYLPTLSLGTLFELGYAYAKGKQVIVICDDYCDHPFISVPFIVHSSQGWSLAIKYIVEAHKYD